MSVTYPLLAHQIQSVSPEVSVAHRCEMPGGWVKTDFIVAQHVFGDNFQSNENSIPFRYFELRQFWDGLTWTPLKKSLVSARSLSVSAYRMAACKGAMDSRHWALRFPLGSCRVADVTGRSTCSVNTYCNYCCCAVLANNLTYTLKL